jgi:GNAT superfamily N-acetyltransferase
MTIASDFLIRPVMAKDRAEWQALWAAYLEFYVTVLPADVYDQTFMRIVGDDVLHGLVAEREGRLVGLVHYLFHATCWKIESVCYLQDLFTRPEARGQGIARALIEAVYAKADAAKAPAVYWMTQENNYPGRILYDKVGLKTPFIRYIRPL